MLVTEYSDGILLQFSYALITKSLIDLPEALIVMLSKTFYHTSLIPLLEVCEDLLG